METTQLPAAPVTHPRGHDAPASAANGSAARNGHASAGADHDQIDLNVPPPQRGWIVAAAAAAVVALALLLVVGIIPRLRGNRELAADVQEVENAPVPVNVVTPTRAPVVMPVRLPGTLRPWQEVSIFARTTGYLKKYYVDISNQVTKGQLMADIDSPEVDAQLRGAQATLLQQQAAAAKAKTDLGFAQTTWQRFQSLKGTSGVTQQELDQYQAQYNSAISTLRSAEANVAVAEADVKRYSELQSFEKLSAPFSGVVTGRAFDVGAMILANPTSVDTQPLFKVAENDVLRAFVYVPQSYALTITQGMAVKITARERPGRVFTGYVMGTTNYLDPSARSLMTEVKLDNPDLALLPGMFVDTSFEVKRDKPPLIIPAAALVMDSEGNRVGIVQDGKVHFVAVTLGVDYGNEIEITGGLGGDEEIIGNPGGRTIEGAVVKVAGRSQATLPTGIARPAEKEL